MGDTYLIGEMTHDPIDELRRHAADLETQVSGDRARSASRRALMNPTPPVRRPRRMVVAVVTTGLMAISNVGLAAAADPAVPGDPLYGVDRAYESIGGVVGIGGTHAGERASEVLVLQARGESARVLELVQETLAELLESDDPAAAVEEFTAGLGNDPERTQRLMDVARGTETTGQEISDIATEFARSVLEGLDVPDHVSPGGPNGPGSEGPPDDPGNSNSNRNNENGNPNNGTPPQTPGEGTPANPGQGGAQP